MPLLDVTPIASIASGLKKPVFVTAPPGDTARLFIVEQGGKQRPARIKVLNLTTLTVNPVPFLEIDDVVGADDFDTEQGLLGLAFHPDYATNGFFYVNLVAPGGEREELKGPDGRPTQKINQGVTHVRRYTVSAANPDLADKETATTILTINQPFQNHNGGWLAFGPRDGLLYIATGDGGLSRDPGNRAQNLGSLLGKMLRVDVNGDDFPGDPAKNYAIPPGNPFRNRPGARPEIWAFGLRNPWRNSFDRDTGDLYIGDVGQDNLEEVNFQPASSPGGENYGWRPREGSKPTPRIEPPEPKPPGAVDPIHEYPTRPQPHAIVGGYVYRGAAIPDFRGTYLFGDVFTKIWSFRNDGIAKTVAAAEVEDRTDELKRGTDQKLSSFGEDAAGELYIVYLQGDVLRVTPGKEE
jgi:glucose/arabinose dehydrogenase